MKQLSIDQIHDRCLKIAIEFDKICTKHDIPYYMLGGTMLGAIRHQGFIPWDDDMDFGVPRPYYDKLYGILSAELSEQYQCYTYKNNPVVYTPFCKIADTETLLHDPLISVPLQEQIGLNIDIFPLDFCDINDPKIKKLFFRRKLLQCVFVNNIRGNRMKNFLKKLVRLVFPLSRQNLTERIEMLLKEIQPGGYLSNLYGRWGRKEMIPIEWYGHKRFKFEGYLFRGIEEYDKYLRSLYKDYMTLPPDEHRISHTNRVYLR